MTRIADIERHVTERVRAVLEAEGLPTDISLSAPPKPEMGDLALPCFPFARVARKAPQAIAQDLAGKIEPDELIESAAGEGPYLNLRLRTEAVTAIVLGQALAEGERFGAGGAEDKLRWMVEYSAPNTNKPQHLGHVRNNLIGEATSRMLALAGHDVIRVNLINDRGIHICKSMLAYQQFGQGETPERTGEKGDHFVGRYYVRFDKALAEEHQAAGTELSRQDWFNQGSKLGAAAQEMLRQWEAGDPETVALWKTMNQWVYDGFDETYRRLGVGFDRVYYESDTYLLGKTIVEEGLQSGVFTRRDDGAVICDLEKIGLTGNKVLLRSDGTSVYMTQDLGTAIARFDEYRADRMTYVVADEQEYHFQVLFGILGLLREPLKGACHHLSYGMVHLPEGKMKSREGTVVDADDLMDGMRELAAEQIRERDPDGTLTDGEVARRAEIIGLAALKYYLLNFTPRATITFEPKKSIDFLGQTGPYCLYSYARVRSLFRKAGREPGQGELTAEVCQKLQSPLERAVIRELQRFPDTITYAAKTHDSSKVADHVWRVAKAFSAMYNDRDHQVVGHPDKDVETARLLLAGAVAAALKTGLTALGIDTLEAM